MKWCTVLSVTNWLRKFHCSKSLQQIPALELNSHCCCLQGPWSGGGYQPLPAEIWHGGKTEDSESQVVFVPRGAAFQNQVNHRWIPVFFVGQVSEFDILPVHFVLCKTCFTSDRKVRDFSEVTGLICWDMSSNKGCFFLNVDTDTPWLVTSLWQATCHSLFSNFCRVCKVISLNSETACLTL